ncbi:MAG: trigger factor [Bacillota bacterium]|nr:trigger factor [Bacillota bacterium]
MKSTVEKKENNVVTLRVTFSAEEFEKGMQRVFQRQKNRFNVPGFRRGKAPMNLVLRMYGEGILYEDVADLLISKALSDAIDEHALEVIARPDVEIENIGRGRDFVAVFQIPVTPEVTLGRYIGVEAVKPELKVDPEMVDREIEQVRNRNARMVSIDDRAAEMGDTVTIDYVGTKDGVAFEGGTAEDAELVLGSGQFIPGFEEQVAGHEIGDEFDVELTFPEEYQVEELKGAPAVFHVKLHAIRRKELPELDDDFAMDVSEYDTMEEYRESIRERQLKSAEERVKVVFENNVIDAVVAEAQVDIPEIMIENRIDRFVEEQTSYYRQMGVSYEDFLKHSQQTEESFRERFRRQAEISVRASLVLEAIVKAENIEASDEEADAELERVAAQYHQDPEELIGNLTLKETETLLRQLDKQVVLRKAVDLIRDSAFALEEPEQVEVDLPPVESLEELEENPEAAAEAEEETAVDD